MPTEDELELIADLYWDTPLEEIADELDVSVSTISRWKQKHLNLPYKSEWNRVEYQHGQPMDRILYHLHYDALLPTTDISEALDISRATLAEWFEKTGVEKRSQSEAERVKNQKMSDEERREQTEAAREKHREKYGDGGYVEVLWDKNPEQMKEQAESVAGLGAEARDENGMRGQTGPDHPRWKGGRCLRDCLRKMMGDVSWDEVRIRVRERANHECEMCGRRQSERGLDVHHIVPLVCGGTNDEELLMALCRSCHQRVERYSEQIFGLGSGVLFEEGTCDRR